MARCARKDCARWRPDALVRRARVGVLFDDEWYCSASCLEQQTAVRLAELHQAPAASAPAATPRRLGALLVHLQVISGDVLQIALRQQRQSGLRLGAQLRQMGVASSEDVLRGLSAQGGVPYLTSIEPSRIAHGPGGLSREAVRALGLVPFEQSSDGTRLRVAAVAPLRRLAINALREMTGWTIEPFLVDDQVWSALLAGYGTAADGTAATGVDTVRTIPDAAARIARAAARGVARRMQQARCDPYVWVRLEGTDRAEDLLLSMDSTFREAAWPAAPTRH